MSGEGRSNLFVRSSSEEENGKLSRTISLSSVQEIPALEIVSENNGASFDDSSYSSLSVPSKSKSKKKGKSSI